jgi:hypothetical protein
MGRKSWKHGVLLWLRGDDRNRTGAASRSCLYSLAPIISLLFAGLSPIPFPEVTPVSAGGLVWVSTDHSYRCHWANGQISCGVLAASPEPGVWWRRSYAGVYAVEKLAGRIVAFVHGENKNTISRGVERVNTITRDRSCFSGGSPYRDCAKDYFGAVSMMVDGKDQGPIVWPAAGYDGSHGVRHPTSIVFGGFVYVFYLDTSRGICVARARPGALRFSTWTGKGWARSLPKGFNRWRPRFDARGPDARAIMGRTFFFAVERDGAGFVGLGFGDPTDRSFGTTVWRSKDLLHWSKGRTLWLAYGADVASAFDATAVRYPRPVLGDLALATSGDGKLSWLRF